MMRATPGPLLLLLLLLLLLETCAGHQLIQVTPQTQDQLDLFKTLEQESNELDFWIHPSFVNQTIDVRVPPSASEHFQSLLSLNQVKHRVLLQDIEEVLKRERSSLEMKVYKQSMANLFSLGAFQTLDETYRWMDMMVEKHSKTNSNIKVSKLYLGKSFNGNPMFALKFTYGRMYTLPVYWIECGSNGRDWLSVSTGIWIAEKLMTQKFDKDIHMLLSFVDIVLVIVANPDGYHFCHKQDRFWSKTRSSNMNSNCPGANLDQNWTPPEHQYTPGRYDTEFFSFYNPCRHSFPGFFPFSEPEASNMAAFIRRNGHVQALISVQGYEPRIMFPPGRNCGQDVPNANILREMASKTSEHLLVYGPRLPVGSLCRLRAPEVGSVIDWVYENGIKYTFVFGLRGFKDHGFLSPNDQISLAGIEAWDGLKYLMENIKRQIQKDHGFAL